MGFRSQKRRSRRNTQAMRLAFWLIVPLVALSVHGMLSLPLWLAQWFTGYTFAPTGFFWANIGTALFLILGGWWLESSCLRQGGGIALARRLGARPADVSQPREHVGSNIVQELCIAARMPAPALMVLDRSPQLNAMAVGWSHRDRAVVVTHEALAQLSRNELQAVIAHELSHIREGDTALNMQLTAMVYGLQMVHGYGRSLHAMELVFPRVFGGLMMYAGLAGWLAGRVLQAAISRQREFLADAQAVEWTRQRDALIAALEKIHQHNQPLAPRDLLADWELMGNRLEFGALSHMWLAPSLEFQGRALRWLDSHPSLEERLRRLTAPVQF